MNPIARWAARGPFYYGWVVAGSVSLTTMAAMTFAVSTFSVFVDPLTEEFGWSRTQISGAMSVGTLGAAFAGPLFGRWVDRYGARLLLSGGSLLMAGALFGLGAMQNLFMLYLFYTLGRTVMMNVEHLIGTTVVANWFIRRRAISTALVLASSRTGLGLWPALAALLFIVVDWRMAFVAMGVSVLAVAVVPWLFVVARRPEEVGLSPDGDSDGPVGDGRPLAERVNAAGMEPQWTAREAVRTRTFWLVLTAATMMLFVGAGIGFHRIPYFVDKGLPSALVGPVLIGFAVGMGVGGFLVARLTRGISERTLMALLMSMSAVLMFVLLNTPANWFAVLFSLVEGTVWGAVLTLQPVLWANFFGRTSVGTIRGLAHPFIMTGNAGGALFGGVVYDNLGQDYTWVFGTFGFVLLGGAFASLMARRPMFSALAARGA